MKSFLPTTTIVFMKVKVSPKIPSKPLNPAHAKTVTCDIWNLDRTQNTFWGFLEPHKKVYNKWYIFQIILVLCHIGRLLAHYRQGH